MQSKILPTGGANYRIQFRVACLSEENSKSLVEFNMMKKPKLPALAASLILPGAGQLYQGYRKKGIVMFFGVAGLAYFAAQSEISFRSDLDSYEADRSTYRAAGELDEIEAARTILESSFNAMKTSEKTRNTIWGVLAGTWTINILDVAF